jgi:hypothetical protein
MTNKKITIHINTVVSVDKAYTHAELIELSGISRKTWFTRLKENNWKKTEILALKYLEIIKD